MSIKNEDWRNKTKQAEVIADKLSRLSHEKLTFLVTIQISSEVSSYFYYPKFKTNIVCNFDKRLIYCHTMTFIMNS